MLRSYMSQPLLSIMIPTYNRKEELRRAIFSILSQELQSPFNNQIEVIVQNNASTDGTYEFLESIKNIHPALKIFHNPTNIQIYGNMVEPIKNTKGKYVMYLTDDDYFLQGALEKIINFLNSTDYDFIRLNFITYFEKSIRASTHRHFDTIITHKTKNVAQIASVFASTHIQTGNIIKKEKIDMDKLERNLYDNTKRWFCYITPIVDLSTNFAFIPEALIIHTWENELHWDGQEEQATYNEYKITADGLYQIFRDSSIPPNILLEIFYQLDPNTKLYPYTKKYLPFKTRVKLWLKRHLIDFAQILKRKLLS